ncbi:MAG TPA: AAA family ATPase, partial [Gemmatimonadaceae bacterium]|nr:AAA family ATPase [Gemmatimonadaceae bacterium]
MARKGIEPIKLRKDKDEQGRYLMDAAIAYGNLRSAAVFGVDPDTGACEMVEDESFPAMEGLYAPIHPTLTIDPSSEYVEMLRAQRAASGEESREESTGAGAGGVKAGEEEEDQSDAKFEQILRELSAQRGTEPVVGRDREVTEAAVATLLEEAIRERDGSLLLQHFNSETAADKPIERLATMILNSAPIIVIESDIPFVEDFVGGLIAAANEDIAKGRRYRAPAVNGDDVKCWVDMDAGGVRIYFMSFHAYRSLYDPERTAHELGIKDAAVLIGADRLTDVPEPLRRITDLVLKFPRIDRKLFARIFERVFGTKPSAGWEGKDSDWTRYLVPADFHAPRRLGLSPDSALAFLRDRVENRLKLVSAEAGPRLSELNGMGEARQIAEDLISDIRAAQAGQIPWANVDKGLLLVGRPGTGKTTLARAIAKECGIKFVVSSATGWQAAGSLDAHLRAMRADFTEARRFAPSILFIDEIDSVGNRERLSGQNAVYQTDVINGLLEQ